MRARQKMAYGTLGVLVLAGMVFLRQPAWGQHHLTIIHDEFTRPQPRGYPLVIQALIDSPAGIRKAEVFCRPASGGEFVAVPMQPVDDQAYRAVIPDWMTAGTELMYYITATDQEGRSASQGFVGFPLRVRFVSTQPPTREERLQDIEDVLNILRQRREATQPNPYSDPRLAPRQ